MKLRNMRGSRLAKFRVSPTIMRPYFFPARGVARIKLQHNRRLEQDHQLTALQNSLCFAHAYMANQNLQRETVLSYILARCACPIYSKSSVHGAPIKAI